MAIIGTMRAEEAKVFDGEAGYHPFHTEDGEAYGSFEVFWYDNEGRDEDGDEDTTPSGWYWQACFPGCMPDSDTPAGPFSTSYRAREDADEFMP